MIPFIKFIGDIAIWLYLACIAFLLFALRNWWRATQEYQNTIYPLEKEVAAQRARRALILVAVIAAVVVLIFYMRDFADSIPSAPPPTATPPFPLPAVFRTATPTPPLATPTFALPSPTPLRPPVSPTPRPVATVNSVPLPPPAPPRPTCPNPGVRIISPGVDARLVGLVPIIGTANIANFQFYKLEYGLGEAPGQWNVFGDIRYQAVNDGLLGTLNANALPPGIYRIQLTVVDIKGQFPAPCSVRVAIGE